MDISIFGRNTRVSDEARQRVEDKLAKIETFVSPNARVEVHVVHEKNPRNVAHGERVEITVYDRQVIRSEAAAEDRVVAFDTALAKVTERLRKLHSRHQTRHQNKLPLHEALPEIVDQLGREKLGKPALEEAPQSVIEWDGIADDATTEVPIDGTPIVIRSKVHEAIPMTTAEAIDQMELVGHDFYLFIDSETDLPSAVYRRRGWTYGVIRLEPAKVSAS